jgi:hypothetical protein
MDFKEYQLSFDPILCGENTNHPYDDPHFVEYVKLNHSRMNRWLKRGSLEEKIVSTIQSIDQVQRWIVITEPWCGDAAHVLPFIVKMAELNPKIELSIQLRDAQDSEIEDYLTDGTRSIPKLIVRDEYGKDLIVWGPRPQPCQKLAKDMIKEGIAPAERKIALQNWYNKDEGTTVQREICRLIESIN